jgi:hypothetical protein
MKRSIELCGMTVLCIAFGACSSVRPPKEEPVQAPAAQPESETAAVAAEPEQAESSETAQVQPAPEMPSGGRYENLTCFSGSEDRHARIGVQLVNGEVNYFAYYSKWRPRTCSLEAGRGDTLSRWTDNGKFSTVTLADQKGQLQIEHTGSTYRFGFVNVDRVRYCGMPGKINGTLTVTRGKASCVVEGVMDGHAM